tara:strand:+ start:923 stop:1105 length:183 start_codon:yes stop_codon:yes gene_type:complete
MFIGNFKRSINNKIKESFYCCFSMRGQMRELKIFHKKPEVILIHMLSMPFAKKNLFKTSG